MNNFKKKNFKILIIGFGSIGQQHYKALKDIKIKNNVFFLSRRIIKNKNFITKKNIKNFNPDYIIICSNTNNHIKDVEFIERNLKKKIVLIEKPIFDKVYKITPKKNTYFVNYQLRFHPVIQKLKKTLSNKKILNLQISCKSYLPNWRKRDYRKSYSSKKIGGGVLLDLSHELDYMLWIFKNIQVKYSKIIKISKLQIQSNDYVFLAGKVSKGGMFSLNLTYFSKHPSRSVSVDCDNFSFHGNLIDNYYKINSGNKQISNHFNMNQLELLKQVHKKILSKDFKDLCSFKEGLGVLKFIKKNKNN